MVFYFVYKASKEFKNRGLIPKRLKALNCRRISRSFWMADDDKVNEVLRVIGENQPILLKRTRETRKPEFDDEDNLIDIGSLVVVAYNAEKDEKGRARGMLRKAPCIRLCSSAYAFCQNHRRYDKKGELVDANRFFTFIKEIDEDAKIFPRMTIINASSLSILQERVIARVEKEADEIIKKGKALLQATAKTEMDKKRLREEGKKLSRRSLWIKKVSNFYEKWLRINSARAVMRIYSVTRKLRSIEGGNNLAF